MNSDNPNVESVIKAGTIMSVRSCGFAVLLLILIVVNEVQSKHTIRKHVISRRPHKPVANYDDVSDMETVGEKKNIINEDSGLIVPDSTPELSTRSTSPSFMDSINEVEQVKNSMENAGMIRDSSGNVNKAKTAGTMKNIREKAKSMNEDGEASDSVGAAGAGLAVLVQGVRGGAWTDVVTGGLDMISAVAGMLGPMGGMIGTVLGIASMMFGMFGGATGGEESTEDIIQQVVEKALLNAKAEELRAQVNGVKKLFTSLSHSVANFRDTKNITYDQALSFYDQGFTGVQMFGIMEHYINKWCDIGDANSFDTDEKKIQLNEDTNRCLDMVNLYCDLSVLRQILLADMASVVAEVGISGTPEVFMSLIRKEQKSDKKLLTFLIDPTNHRAQRYVVNKFFTSLPQYTTITTYLKKLMNLDKPQISGRSKSKTGNVGTEVTQDNKIMKKFVLVCSEVQLKGDCYEFESPALLRKNAMKGWINKISSLYVADGLKVRGFHRGDWSGSMFGPYFGPSVYGKVSGAKQWESMKIDRTSGDAMRMLRVCESDYMNSEEVCETLDYGNYKDLDMPRMQSTPQGPKPIVTVKESKKFCKDTCVLYDDGVKWCRDSSNDWGECVIGRDWDERIKSITIPKGMEVTAWSKESFKGTKYGPFYGPATIQQTQPPAKWKSLKLARTKLSTSQMVQFCSEEGLSGYCDYAIIPDRVDGVKYMSVLKNVHGVNWEEDKRIKSMNVPGGVAVHTFSDRKYKGFAMGPYTGPATLNKIDGADGEDDRIKSMKLVRKY